MTSVHLSASLISDPILDPILHGDVGPTGAPLSPLLLVIGYTNGVQIWVCPVSGEAQEVMSVRQGPVKILRLLPAPKEGYFFIKSLLKKNHNSSKSHHSF